MGDCLAGIDLATANAVVVAGCRFPLLPNLLYSCIVLPPHYAPEHNAKPLT